jgi:uncharacterized repeat protein (TIGR01451 family)
VGDNSPTGGHYNWASPLIHNGYAYVGTASLCDDPLVQGQLLQVDLSTHQIVKAFNAVPNGQVGGGIWTSPSLDASTNTIYVSTGTQGVNPSTQQPYSLAIVALDASTLAVKGSWQLPLASQIGDSDWGTTPILFSDANGRALVAAVNKDGNLYAFDRANVSAGPVWQRDNIAVGGACPECGDGSTSSGAFGNGLLYMAGGNTTVNGLPAMGSVRAFDPATGNVLWEHNAPGVVISTLAYANGLLVDAGGTYVEVLNAATGARLYSYNVGGYGEIYNLSIANGQIYVSASDSHLYVLGLPNPAPTPTVTPLPDAHCPAGWTCQDVGGATPPGSETVTAGTYSVTGGGPDITGTADGFHFVSQGSSGDTQISARLITQSGTNALARAGIMIRQTSNAGAPYYAAFLTPGNGLVVQYRSQPGGGTTTAVTSAGTASAPLYLRLQRRADSFVAATSSDGFSYTLVPGSQATVVLPTNVLAGLAVSSHSATQTNTAQFSSVTLGTVGAAPATPTPSVDAVCPESWSCGDIGSYAPAGSETVSGGVWTVRAAGQDIGNAADQFRFIWQPFSGDGVASARVLMQTVTNNWAKAGVMIRGSTDPAAPFYAAYLTPQNGVMVQYRLKQNAFTRYASVPTTTNTAPQFLEVSRTGSTFEAATSTDGITWIPIAGSSIQFDLGSTALAGIAVTARAPGVLGTAQIDSVNVQSAALVCTSAARSSAALAAGYCSRPPSAWTTGQTRIYTVTVTNTGTQTWNAGATDPVRLGIHFGTSSDYAGDGWATDQRFWLPNDVLPGQSVTMPVAVTAPLTAGSYVLRARMVKENVTWFDQILRTNATVAAPAPTPTATPTGPPLAASYSSAPPTSWSVGQTQTYAVKVTNTGTQTWNAGATDPVRLGIHFGTSSDYPGDGWATDQRFWLPNDVPPGQSVTMLVTVTAPLTAGGYVLRARMVKENVAWFDQILKTNVTVGSPTPTPTAT